MPSARVAALIADARAAFQRGENEAVKRLGREAVEVARAAGDDRGVAEALTWLARTAFRDGDTTAQRRFACDALAAAERTGDRSATFGPRHLLVAADRAEGNYQAARSGYEATRELARELGNQRGVAMETLNIAAVSLLLGDPAAADRDAREALRATNDMRLVAVCISTLGGAAIARGDLDHGARLLGAAEGVIGRTGTMFDPDDDGEHKSRVAHASEALGDRYGALADEGRGMGDAAATASALGEA